MSQQLNPKNIIASGLCIGCGICVGKSMLSDVEMRMDQYGFLKPIGPDQWMKETRNGFEKICPFSPVAANEDELAAELFPDNKKDNSIGRYQDAYVGHVSEGDFRMQGSSGGMVSWVAAELLRQGYIDGVAHVMACDNPNEEGKYFRYTISRSVEDLQKGSKSRYYPIELSEIVRTINDVPGRYAVIGIPCFIKAVQLLRKEDPLFKERIVYTLGLFCGHMKSARFIESFAWQMHVKIDEVKAVEFRQKYADRPANWYNAKLTMENGKEVDKDWWHLKDGDWGAGYFMNSPCNFCDDVVAETADISFGDAWLEPYSSDGRGTNVVVIRSNVIHQLIQIGIQSRRLKLQLVDHDFVHKTQEAGFRQRREGLAYRLTWNLPGIEPRKRVKPDAKTISFKRKVVYKTRFYISAWSHKIFRLAAMLDKPAIYILWAGKLLGLYHALVYERGKFGKFLKRIGLS